ncbi:SGNH/GDSL hydrolase family protein [Aliidiomarina halalkaliphila]|uniref:SGNH/GDSL hydrolase family protein n=1 Tax=Aliidiomarina halalkaliphila TaxID=2593535 RepID=A0A552WYR4_9GAMM|nr:SGNH/GDSL hydrolase family protein [Aliidiomarina halalkaliphila]TRW47962.1 SGNH/GDSL hydrolase family protein [Aliidiomarina halalkaliphila]
MLTSLAKIILAPALLKQARYVRTHTPRLPEPEGPREGVIEGAADTQSDVSPLRVLIVGDSAGAGVGVERQEQALSGQLLRCLQHTFPGRRIHWCLWAKNGDTTAMALIKLHLRPRQDFDVVITSLGVNDVTRNVRPYRFRRQQQALVDLLTSKFSARHVILTAVPPMHSFPALPQPLRWFLGQQASRLTRELDTVAAVNDNCEVLDVAFPLEPGLMASDGFHPGEKGYPLWAEAIVKRIVEAKL